MLKNDAINEILQLCSEGLSMEQICKKSGYGRITVTKYLKENSIWIKRNDMDKDIVAKYLNENKSIAQISKETGINRDTVSYRLAKNGIDKRPTEIDTGRIIELYNSGLLVYDITQIMGCCMNTVAKALKNNSIDINNHMLLIDTEKLLAKYAENKSLIKTAAFFNASTAHVKKKLIEAGIHNFRTRTWDKSQDIHLVKRYEDGETIKNLAKSFGFSHTTIASQLARLNVKMRKDCCEERKSGNYTNSISSSHLNRIKNGATIRGLEFEVEEDFLYSLFLMQGSKCKLSGVDISLPKNSSDMIAGIHTASLDRIDSSRGYTKDNVQWVHKSINMMKQAMSDQDFILWCRKVSDFNL